MSNKGRSSLRPSRNPHLVQGNGDRVRQFVAAAFSSAASRISSAISVSVGLVGHLADQVVHRVPQAA